MKKDIEYIRKLFPGIEKIYQPELRRKVANAWIEALKRSKHERIEYGVFSPSIPQYKLVDHINAVTNISIEIAKTIKEIHGFNVNLDYLIAGALLHDIDKLIIYEKRKDNYVTSEITRILPHGFIGASIAQRMDLPQEIVHTILSHTTKAPIYPATLEAVIVHYADYVDADAMLFSSQSKMLLQRFKLFGA